MIVLDAWLPGPDGLSVCRELKRRPDTANATVILLTGHVVEEQTARDAGCDGYLRKPCIPEELLQLIRTLRPTAGSDRSP